MFLSESHSTGTQFTAEHLLLMILMQSTYRYISVDVSMVCTDERCNPAGGRSGSRCCNLQVSSLLSGPPPPRLHVSLSSRPLPPLSLFSLSLFLSLPPPPALHVSLLRSLSLSLLPLLVSLSLSRSSLSLSMPLSLSSLSLPLSRLSFPPLVNLSFSPPPLPSSLPPLSLSPLSLLLFSPLLSLVLPPLSLSDRITALRIKQG